VLLLYVLVCISKAAMNLILVKILVIKFDTFTVLKICIIILWVMTLKTCTAS